MKDRVKILGGHVLAILLMLVVITAYFFPQLQGKVIEQTDLIQSKAKSRAIVEYTEETGDRYLWNPGQLGGMSHLYAIPAMSNLLLHTKKLVRLGISRPIGIFFSVAIFNYFLFLFLGAGKWLSAGLAIATALSTNNIILWKTGHVSKIETLEYTPLILLGLFLLYEKRKYLLGFSLFSIGMGLNLFHRHPQMTYYLFMALIFYGVYVLYRVFKQKNWTHFIKATCFVIMGILLGAGTSASKLWGLQEHKESSMRGGQVLQVENVDETQKTSTGLDWDYAMQWSNGWKDVMATMIPRFVGGGSGEKVGRNSESFKAYRFQKAPLYWGTLPGTEAPIYLGAITIFLFIFSFLILKNPMKWWLFAAVIFTIFVSGGSNFPFLNKPLFDYLPLYNSFRAPSSILAVTVFLIPIMIVLGLSELKKFKRLKSGGIADSAVLKKLYISFGITGGICLLSALFGPSIFSFESASDARYAQQGVDLSIFITDRKSGLFNDALRSLTFITLSAAIIWFWIRGKVKISLLFGGIGFLMMIDIIGVNLRYLSSSDYTQKKTITQSYEMRDVDRQIKSVESERHAYRVLDIPNFGSSIGSYYHNTIGGYDPVKMRRYQDLIDRHISQNNMRVLNMLNTKYIINTNAQGKLSLATNQDALGNAWFVDRIIPVSSPNEEIDALNIFNPGEEAVILTSEFENYLTDFQIIPDSSASIKVLNYSPDRIEYETYTSTEQLAVFSETWFGPDKGWKVYIDGTPSEFIRANYDLRAMRVPGGKHNIVFEFKPNAYYVGEKISLASSGILLLILLGALYYNREFLSSLMQKTEPRKTITKKSTGRKSKKKRRD